MRWAGESYYVGSMSLTYPMGLPQELGMTGRVWSDFGSLFGVHPSGTSVSDTRSLRVAAGVGVSWKSPLGPIKIDIGVPVKREAFDRTELVHVSFGTRF